jgi:hypothetical protein
MCCDRSAPRNSGPSPFLRLTDVSLFRPMIREAVKDLTQESLGIATLVREIYDNLAATVLKETIVSTGVFFCEKEDA